MMGQINLTVDEISGGGEDLRHVGEHVHHGLVWAAVDQLAAIHMGREVEGFNSAVPAKVGQFCAVTESFIQGNVLGWEIASHEIQLAWGNWLWCGNTVKFKTIRVVG